LSYLERLGGACGSSWSAQAPDRRSEHGYNPNGEDDTECAARKHTYYRPWPDAGRDLRGAETAVHFSTAHHRGHSVHASGAWHTVG
jgi:hypothetical protein